MKLNKRHSINYNNSIQTFFCKFYPFYREFHSSVCFLSDKELEKRVNELKDSSSSVEDISISSETGKDMKQSILNVKNEISNNNNPLLDLI